MLKLLSQLVSINSIFPNEQKLAVFLESYLKSLGFKTQRQLVSANRFNVLAVKGIGKKSILFYGHMDTAGITAGWKTNPLKLITKGDKLYGLGSRDMKSGITAILEAIKNIEISNYKIKIAFCVDEENISQGAYKLVKSGFIKDVELIISADSGDIFNTSRLPFRYILGRRGRCVAEVEIPGRSYHGAFPKNGVDASLEASKFIIALQKIKQANNKFLKSASLFIRKIDCQAIGLTLPGKAYLEIDKQLVPPETPEAFVKSVYSLAMNLYNKEILNKNLKKLFKASLKPRETPYIKPFVQNKNKYIEMIDTLIKNKYGIVDKNYGLSVADDNILYHDLHKPTVCLGVEGGNPHSANEWVSFKSMLALKDLYIEILNTFSSV